MTSQQQSDSRFSRGGIRLGRAGQLHPFRLYERVEVAAALMTASARPGEPLHHLARALPDAWRWRGNPAGIVVTGSRRHPERLAVVDDDQALTFGELDRRTNALAGAWREEGWGAHTTIGLLSHNRALFLEAMIAGQKLGAQLVFLNTGFAAAQVADVVADEGVDVLVHDDDLASAAGSGGGVRRITADDVRRAVMEHDDQPFAPPDSPGRMVVLTSGTTGRPKGAVRAPGGSVFDAAAVLTMIPLMSSDTMVVPAPLFHGLGLFPTSLALALGSTVILRSAFDAEGIMNDVAVHRARALVLAPVMLHRILGLPRRRLAQYDVSSLRIILCGGAALSGELARRGMDEFGDILYNVYGSTEVALATVATPRDLRGAPGTAGRPSPGVTVRVLDDRGRSVPPGTVGRIFVGSRLRFDGYTGGGSKDVAGSLLATGDLGRFDRWGRLFVEGREDEMIVSGGENVFPAEIEDVLSGHPQVYEAAAIGVPDEEFGQRLRAFVVLRPHATVDGEDLRRHVHERLARFKTPREVIFVDRLPRNATGKVLKRELAEHRAAAHPEGKDANAA